MALTEDEKQKIIEQEEFRQKIREQETYKAQLQSPHLPPKKKGVGCLTIIVVVFVSIAIFGAIISSQVPPTPNTSPQNTASQEELIGAVRFDQMQFHVINQEQKDWKNCRFTVNGKYRFPPEQGLLGSETKVVRTIEANSTYDIGAGEFTLKDGSRFNAITIKPQNLSMACDNGFGYWEW
ncbi:hypothetical protein A2634_02750 [Candidatus Amesbacteria bacterium RIFCSPHIGHO2_01_FULL_48_32]|nr:MAG: hypothetical protein A2634_02750 [Candidatus Amesbacteria bacterium RIFCSPHIGHO2_01_FULL_48_32]